MFALPQTLALFSGQHNWYNTGGGNPSINDGNQVPCKKCHGDIQAELDQPGYPNSMHKNQDCLGCHITAPQSRGLTVGGPIDRSFHAAAAPMCLDCHDGSVGGDARSILNGSEEVHKPFVKQANTPQNSMLKGANEACLGCHTHIAVDINWTKAYMMKFNVTETVSTNETGITTHDWTVGNFSVQGTARMETYGNQTGGTTGSSPIVIDALPAPTPPNYNPNNP